MARSSFEYVVSGLKRGNPENTRKAALARAMRMVKRGKKRPCLICGEVWVATESRICESCEVEFPIKAKP